jgi:hypothetical protein
LAWSRNFLASSDGGSDGGENVEVQEKNKAKGIYFNCLIDTIMTIGV